MLYIIKQHDLCTHIIVNFTPVPLQINCGYARTAIRELTPVHRQSLTPTIKEQRRSEFQSIFSCFKFPPNEMAQNSRGEFLFDKHCDTILSMFAKKWVPTTMRVAYETHLSLKNWKALSASKKEEHTLSSCVACSRNSKDLQKAFPGKPIYEVQSC